MNDKKKSASSEFEGMSGDKQKALTAALAQIEKQFGKGSIMRLGDAEINQDIQVVSSGSLGLDIALGVGGLARGRVIEIYGPESSGKTTLMQLQRCKNWVVLVRLSMQSMHWMCNMRPNSASMSTIY
jgi:recombination protein RecA